MMFAHFEVVTVVVNCLEDTTVFEKNTVAMVKRSSPNSPFSGDKTPVEKDSATWHNIYFRLMFSGLNEKGISELVSLIQPRISYCETSEVQSLSGAYIVAIVFSSIVGCGCVGGLVNMIGQCLNRCKGSPETEQLRDGSRSNCYSLFTTAADDFTTGCCGVIKAINWCLGGDENSDDSDLPGRNYGTI